MKLSFSELLVSITGFLIDVSHNFTKYIDWKSITTEFIKTIFTAILGFITFKIYQGYKNKKENTLLYIHLLRLKNEADKNLEILHLISKDYNELESLNMKFNLNINYRIYNFYSKVSNLKKFVNEIPIYDDRGGVVDMDYEYGDYAYSQIELLEGQISALESGHEYDDERLNDLKEQLKTLNTLNIYDELTKLVSYKEKVLSNGVLTEPLECFFSKVASFLEQEDKSNHRVLDNFCNSLFEQDNIFSQTLEEYTKLSLLKRRLTKPRIVGKTGIKKYIEFNLWEKAETQLLAIFNIDSYLKLDDLYMKNIKLEFYLWDRDYINTIITLIESDIAITIDASIKLLSKTVKMTNKLFKGI